MKKRNLIILPMLLCFIATIGWAADLQKGMDALENDGMDALENDIDIGKYVRTTSLQKGVDSFNKGHYKTAYKEFLLLAEQGVVFAQYNLGVMYYKGKGVSQDYKQAAKWYTLAAEQGDIAAQNSLGLMYLKGTGVLQDYKQAVKRFTLVAELVGYAGAQNNLGVMYLNGEGVLQDYKQAVKWFTLAAEQGDTQAQYNLGLMYLKGTGVLQDHTKAYMWGNIAASNGYSPSLRDLVSNEMTPSQLEKAQQMSSDCVAANYKGC